MYHFDTRLNQFTVREQEMKAIVEETYSKVDILCRIGLGMLNLATDKIVVAGHSFGGATAIRTAQRDGRVKAILAYDPWMYLINSDSIGGLVKLERPLLTVNTEEFSKETVNYNQWDALKALHSYVLCKKNENIVLKTAYHTDLLDLSVLAPLEH